MTRKILALCVCLAAAGFVSAQPLNWFHSPEEALQAANQSGKLVFADFYTDWCSWCVKLDRETFSDPRFQNIAQRFVLLKANGDVHPEFRRKYNVTGYPTMVFLNGEGREVHSRVVGFRTADVLVPHMQAALDSSSREGLVWLRNPEDAFAAAKQSGMPIFVDAFTTWCHWCVKLDKETFSTSAFQQEAKRFVLLKVDGDVYRDFVLRYGVKGYPTMLFLNGAGEQVHAPVVGFRPAERLVPIMREVPSPALGEAADFSLPWMSNPSQAYAESQATGRPVFAWASMKNCSWCDKLERETFQTPGFADMSAKFVLLKVMREDNPGFTQKFEVKGYPTMLFLNPSEREFHPRVVGYRPASTLLPIMQAALDAYPGSR